MLIKTGKEEYKKNSVKITDCKFQSSTSAVPEAERERKREA